MTVSPETGYPAGLAGPPHSDASSPLGRRNPVWCYKTWTYAQPHRARRTLSRAYQHKRNAPYIHPDAPRVTAGLTQVSHPRTDAAMRCHHLDAAQAGRRRSPFLRGHVAAGRVVSRPRLIHLSDDAPVVVVRRTRGRAAWLTGRVAPPPTALLRGELSVDAWNRSP